MLVAGTQPLIRRLQEGISNRFYAWRDGLVANPRFQRWAAAFPITGRVAAARSRKLFDLCAGFVYSQVLVACTELNLFAILAKGPRTALSLSSELSLSVDATERLLRAATALDLLALRPLSKDTGSPERRYGLGMLGAALLGNPGVVSMIRHHRLLYADLAEPVALLRGQTSKSGTALSRFWPYASNDPTASDETFVHYSRLMSESQSLVVDDILEAYPFHRHRVVMDVGGGDGTFLVKLARHAPNLQVTLFDLPAVAARGAARFEREGLANRAQALGGDAAIDALPAGADLITFVRVLHDHDDAKVLALLRQARAALPPNGMLLIAEPMAGIKGAEPMGDAYFSFYLLAMGSGRARTNQELSLLLEQAGFTDIRLLKTRRPLMTSAMQACCGPLPTEQPLIAKAIS
jgi:demethylspheroidene O-methyltransferase